MKILLVHNRYQLPGGEDEVYRREQQLLVNNGHRVIEYTRDNHEILEYGIREKSTLPIRAIWAGDSYSQVAAILAEERPDLAHFHNTFPLISPAVYYACSAAGVPVVQTLHNPRLLCPAGTLFRKGRTCEECVGRRVAYPAVLHGCYHGSRVDSAVVASTLSIHHFLGTWKHKISRYVVSTEYFRAKFLAAGLPSGKTVVKPHFVDADPGCTNKKGDYALFVGRLAPEKGVSTLLAAWQKVGSAPLFIRGEGPLADAVSLLQTQTGGRVTLLPRMSRSALFDLMKAARFLVWPSEGHYETFGLVAVEAFACGIPVIASCTGVMKDIVKEGRTGLHFIPGDANDLAKTVDWAWTHPDELQRMGQNARAEYEAKYTAERNYKMLMRVYQQAVQEAQDPLPSHGRKALRVADSK